MQKQSHGWFIWRRTAGSRGEAAGYAAAVQVTALGQELTKDACWLTDHNRCTAAIRESRGRFRLAQGGLLVAGNVAGTLRGTSSGLRRGDGDGDGD
jgi:hypothetical protein